MSSLIVNLMNELHDSLSRDDHSSIWDHVGKRELDESIAIVADYYIQYEAERAIIREELREFERYGVWFSLSDALVYLSN